MRIKFKSIIVISIILLSVLIADWNFDLSAKNLDNEMNSTSTSRYNGRLNDEDFDWGEIEVISEPIVGQDINIGDSRVPRIAVENDKIYVVWDDNTDYNSAGPDPDIFYRYYDGSKWSEIQVISEPVPGQNFNNRDSLIPYIAVENGKIYVVWQDDSDINGVDEDQDIFYRCNLTGNSWEDIQVVSEPSQGKNFNIGASMSPKVAVENNKIYVVWQDDNNTNGCGTDGDIFYRGNLTGNSWEDIQVVSEPVLGHDFNIGFSSLPEIAVENGNVYIGWVDHNNTNSPGYNTGIDSNIFFRYYNGNSWSEIEVISEPTKGQNFNIINVNSAPSIAVENDKIYTVWCSNNTPNENWEIFYRCNLNGINWEPIQVISDPVLNSNFNVNFSHIPRIAVENGKIFVVWSDANRTNGYVTDRVILYRCNVTGTNWEDIQIISEHVGGDSNKGEYGFPDIAVNRGKSHIVWVDNDKTNGAGKDSDIFYRYIFLPFILNSSVAPTTGNTSTYFNFTVTYLHMENAVPVDIKVNISGTNYSLFEVAPSDTNYLDGKDYFFNIKNLDIGTHTHQFYASDGKYNFFTALVNKPDVYNTPPNIITENNLIAFEDTYYEVNYEYEDIDIENVGQLGTWNYSTNASWLVFSRTTAILNGTPTNYDVREYWVNITVNDTEGGLDFTNFTLTVINVNDPPIIITEDIIMAQVDKFYEVDYNAIDIDSPLSKQRWSLDTNASWLKIDFTNGILNGTPTISDSGWYNVNVSVDDGDGSQDWHEFILTVIKGNAPPIITTIDVLGAAINELYNVDYEAVDDYTPIDKLAWSLETNASWLNIENNTGILSGVPELSDLGWYWINVSVSDGEGGSDYHNFTITLESSVDEISKKESSWIWLILIVIIIVIIVALAMSLFIHKKQKASKIPIVKAELLQATPKLSGLPGVTTPAAGVEAKPKLPTPTVQVQPQVSAGTTPVPSLTPKVVQPQYQLPQAMIIKSQELGLLQERFLRGEVDLETYKKLRSEIEGKSGENFADEELKSEPQESTAV